MAGLRLVGALDIGHHAQDLLANDIGRIGDADDVVEALRHLRLAIGALHDWRIRIEHELGLREDRAIRAVEAARDLASELDMGRFNRTYRPVFPEPQLVLNPD